MLFLLRLHRRQDLQFLRDELGRARGGINHDVGTERETLRVGRENISYRIWRMRMMVSLPQTSFFLFPFAIFDNPEISL